MAVPTMFCLCLFGYPRTATLQIQITVHCSLLIVFKDEQSENIFRGVRGHHWFIGGRPKAAPTMFYPRLFGYPRTANGRPYNVLSVFVRLFEDGQRPPLQCSIRVCSVIRGRAKTAHSMFYPRLFGYPRTANGRPYKLLSIL